MGSFEKIERLAAKRHGGPKGLAVKLAEWPVDTHLVRRKDDAFLAMMAKSVFSSGFSWQVIETKWPGFIEAFDGFDPKRVAMIDEEAFDALLKDARIVRNGAKIKATIDNARFVMGITKMHGSFGKWLAKWPVSDQLGLMDYLKKNAARLGGATGMYFLRFSGWDAWITSQDVVKALVREGVLEKDPTTKAQWRAVQDAFNGWADESERPRREISRILALSVG